MAALFVICYIIIGYIIIAGIFFYIFEEMSKGNILYHVFEEEIRSKNLINGFLWPVSIIKILILSIGFIIEIIVTFFNSKK